MMLEERPVIRNKPYRNRATNLINIRQIRASPKNAWKKEIVEKVHEYRKNGRSIVPIPAQNENDESESEDEEFPNLNYESSDEDDDYL